MIKDFKPLSLAKESSHLPRDTSIYYLSDYIQLLSTLNQANLVSPVLTKGWEVGAEGEQGVTLKNGN